MTRKRSSEGDSGGAPNIIKKYANRRLYNTVTSSYVTLDHLSQMVKDGVDFVVHDAKTGEDITRQVLTQIIVEEESKGQNLLPISFLRQLISFYGDSLQGLVPQYLEMTMDSFSSNQDQIRKYLNDAFGGMYPFNQIEEMSRQNLAMFQQAVDMFAPFGPGSGTASEKGEQSHEGAAKEDVPVKSENVNSENVKSEDGNGAAGRGKDAALDQLKSQLQAMQQQLDALSKGDD